MIVILGKGEWTQAKNIKLSSHQLILLKGQRKNLKIYGTKNKVRWSSSKKKVVTVSKNGTILAKTSGSAVVTAKIGKKRLRCKIKVENPSLNHTSIILLRGQERVLKIKKTSVKPKWTSNRPSVVEVSNQGKVRGISNGQTVVTAQILGRNLECIVKVIDTEKNFEVLKSFLEQKGDLDENHHRYIEFKVRMDDVGESGFYVTQCRMTYLWESDEYEYLYYVYNKRERNMKLLCKTRISQTSDLVFSEISYSSDAKGEIEGRAVYNKESYDGYSDVSFQITKNTISDLDERDADEVCDLYLSLAMTTWDSYMQSKAKRHFQDLGFLNLFPVSDNFEMPDLRVSLY